MIKTTFGKLFSKTVLVRHHPNGAVDVYDGDVVSSITAPWLADAVGSRYRIEGDESAVGLGQQPPFTWPAEPPAQPSLVVTAVTKPDEPDHPGHPPTTTDDWVSLIQGAPDASPASPPPLPIEGETIVQYSERVTNDAATTMTSALKTDHEYANNLVAALENRQLTDEWNALLAAVRLLNKPKIESSTPPGAPDTGPA